MKIKTKDLRAAIELCLRFTKGRTTMPVLSCVRMEASGGSLSVSATDIVRYVIHKVPCEGDMPACCVPSAMLAPVLAECGDVAEFKLNAELTRLSVLGDVRASLPALPQGEFPAEPKPGEKIGCNTMDVARAIVEGSWACSAEDTVAPGAAQLCRIYTTPRVVGCESNNGYMMTRCEILSIAADSDFCVLPRDATELARILEKPDATLALSESFVSASCGSVRVWINRPAAKPADLSPVLTAPSTPIVSFDEDQLAKVCGVLSLAASLNSQKGAPANVRIKAAKSSDSEGTVSIALEHPAAECSREFNAPVQGEYNKLFAAEKLLRAMKQVGSTPVSVSQIGGGAIRIQSGNCVSLVAGLIDTPKGEV